MVRFLLGLLIIIALAGCGGQASGDEPAGIDKTADPAAPQPPAVKRAGPEAGLPAAAWGPLLIIPGGLRLGPIEPNSIYQVELTLHNTGTVPITILLTSSDCACTVPEDLDGTVIPAGGSKPFQATYNAPARPGVKTAKLLLNFSTGGPVQKALVKIEGDVTMAVGATPAYVDALKGVTSGTIRLQSTDGRPFRVVSTFGEAPVYADGFDPARDEARTAYTVQWNVSYPMPEDCKGLKLWWVVETDHPDCPVLPLRIRHECTGLKADFGWRQRGWIFREYMVNLGALRAGRPIDIDVDLRDVRGTADVYAVESTTPDAAAELITTIDPSDDTYTCRVRFTPHGGYEGMLYAMVMFRSRTGDMDVAFIARVLHD